MAERRDRRRRRIGEESIGYTNTVGDRGRLEFINPYPWMSSVEARVHLELERREVPFTWRWFDGDLAPHLRELMPSYAPEFTLKEYKTVIIVQGNYFSQLPGIIDTVAMAQVLLEADGWKVVVLWEDDILRDLQGVLEKHLPWLKKPPVKGKPRVGPYGRIDLMANRRKALSAFNLRRAKYALDRQREETRDRTDTAGRRRRRPRRRRTRRQRNRERA